MVKTYSRLIEDCTHLMNYIDHYLMSFDEDSEIRQSICILRFNILEVPLANGYSLVERLTGGNINTDVPYLCLSEGQSEDDRF